MRKPIWEVELTVLLEREYVAATEGEMKWRERW